MTAPALEVEMTMKKSKQRKLERAGFTVAGAKELLGLSEEEAALIDLKVRLMRMLKSVRQQNRMTQQRLAKLVGSSQSRVAKLEAASPDVSLDLICKSLFALGVSRRQIANAIASKCAA